MTRLEIIDDTMFTAVPTDRDPHSESTRQEMFKVAQHYILSQWNEVNSKPLSVQIVEPIDWTITDDKAVAAAFELNHDCDRCREGKVTAVAYLEAKPGTFIAMANLRYIEEWPDARPRWK